MNTTQKKRIARLEQQQARQPREIEIVRVIVAPVPDGTPCEKRRIYRGRSLARN